MLTAKTVETILQNINAEAPEKWQAGIQTLFLDQAKTIDALVLQLTKVTKQLTVTMQAAAKLKTDFDAAMAGGAPQEGAEGESPSEDVVSSAPPPGAPTVGVDGTPLTPEQQAVEAQMNAAMANPAPAQAGPPSGRPRPPGQGQRRARPQQAPVQPRPRLSQVPQEAVGTSPGGEVLTPEQAEIEAQMEAAAGPRPA